MFCARLAAVEIPLHVDTGVRTNHLKNLLVGDGQFEPRHLHLTNQFSGTDDDGCRNAGDPARSDPA